MISKEQRQRMKETNKLTKQALKEMSDDLSQDPNAVVGVPLRRLKGLLQSSLSIAELALAQDELITFTLDRLGIDFDEVVQEYKQKMN